KWRDDMLKAQEKLKDHEEPVLLVDEIAHKISALDREMRYLINKAKVSSIIKIRDKLRYTLGTTESHPPAYE
ncbi:hypoxia up-regulated protein 1, partial [Elysia marginata]